MAATSSLVGEPPNTQDDYWIVRGMLRGAGLDNADPQNGYTVAPELSVLDLDASKTASILAGMSISAGIMALASCTRLGARLFRVGLRWGADDWMLIPATVSAITSSIWSFLADPSC